MRILAAAFALTLLLVGNARAQFTTEEDTYLRMPHRVHVTVGSGITVPSAPGEFKDYWNAAFPAAVGVGVPIFSWFDINGTFTYYTFRNNNVKTKQRVGYLGVPPVKGGNATTTSFVGSARFIAVPNARYNAFLELGVGYFKTSFDALEIVDETTGNLLFSNEAEDAKGLCFTIGGGVQYAMGETWSSFAKYSWTHNGDDSFNPSNIIKASGDGDYPGGSQQFSTVLVGIMLRI